MIVGGVHDPTSHVVGPDAVHHRAGEVGIAVGIAEPLHDELPRILIRSGISIGSSASGQAKLLRALCAERTGHTHPALVAPVVVDRGPVALGAFIDDGGLAVERVRFFFQLGEGVAVFVPQRLGLLANLLRLFAELLHLFVEGLPLGHDLGFQVLVGGRVSRPTRLVEEVREVEDVFLLPDVVGMTVALGTHQLHAEEEIADFQRSSHPVHLAGVALPVEVESLPLRIGWQIRSALDIFPADRGDFLDPFFLRASLKTGGREDALDELVVRACSPRCGRGSSRACAVLRPGRAGRGCG